MNGRRVYPDADGFLPPLSEGDYGLYRGVWMCRVPGGLHGSLANHQIKEHEDGTITVSPSILVNGSVGTDPEPVRWHGFLERGVWRSC